LVEAVRSVADGSSVSAAAAVMREQGLRTPTGKPMSSATLRYMLASPAITALRVYKGEIVAEGQWEPIVARDDWNQLQAVLSANPTPGPRRTYLLSGIMNCGNCGTKMIGRQRSDGRRAYGCPVDRNHDGRSCGRITQLADPLEAYIEGLVRERLADPATVKAMSTVPDDEDDDRDLEVELEDVQTRLTEIGAAYARGDVDLLTVTTATKSLTAQRDSISTALRQRGANATFDYSGALEHWGDWDTDTQRKIISSVTGRIEIGAVGKGNARRFHPERVTIEWAA
jgi:site-specific DNA recombinase